MARKSKKQTEAEFILIIVAGIVVVFIVSLKFLIETNLIWFVLPIIAGILVLRIYLKKRAEEQRILLEKQAEEQRILLAKQAEEQRIEKILTHQDEWGEAMCQWLIDNGADTTTDSYRGNYAKV